MKTLLPIVISLGLLIPFSPVGEYVWHTTEQQSSTLLHNTQQRLQTWASEFNHASALLAQQWRQTTHELAETGAQSQQHLALSGEKLAAVWQQEHNQVSSQVARQWQTTATMLVQWPQQLWQQAMSSGESQWANLQQQQAQWQHRMSHSLSRLEAQVATQTE